MSRKPLVSCIIIFFNAKKETFFEEAIESVLAQTYENWELLLADDGSRDESTAIALDYARRYPERIRYVEHEGHENRGMSATRNLGIRHSKGEYIAFLDADDVWFPNKLEEQVPLLEARPTVGMLYGRTQYWFSWTENNPCLWRPSPDAEWGDFLTVTSQRFDTSIEPAEQLVLFLENRLIYPCMCSILVRRESIEAVGGFEEEFPNALEDNVFQAKIFLHYPVYVSSKCWDRYRIHPKSFWNSDGRDLQFPGRLNYLLWLESYLQERGIDAPKVWRALQKDLWAHRHPRLHRQLERVRHPVRSLQNFTRKFQKNSSTVPLASVPPNTARPV